MFLHVDCHAAELKNQRCAKKRSALFVRSRLRVFEIEQ
jgi:hypothetical protein